MKVFKVLFIVIIAPLTILYSCDFQSLPFLNQIHDAQLHETIHTTIVKS